jgi:hypothetical protein
MGFVVVPRWNDMFSWLYVKEYEEPGNFMRRSSLNLMFRSSVHRKSWGCTAVNVTGRGTDRVMATRAAQRGVTMTEEFLIVIIFLCN